MLTPSKLHSGLVWPEKKISALCLKQSSLLVLNINVSAFLIFFTRNVMNQNVFSSTSRFKLNFVPNLITQILFCLIFNEHCSYHIVYIRMYARPFFF